MDDTTLPDEWLFKIKAATRDLILRAGGLERSGSIVGRGKSTVARWGSTDHSDVISLAAALLLELETGAPLVTQTMAEMSGRLLTVREGDKPNGFMHSFTKLTKETSDVMAAVTEAQADGVITPNEQQRIDLEISQMQDAASDLRSEIAGAQGQPLHVVR